MGERDAHRFIAPLPAVGIRHSEAPESQVGLRGAASGLSPYGLRDGRIVRAVELGTGETHNALVIWLEWLATTESDIDWYRTLSEHRRRLRALEAVARKPVPPLSPPWECRRKVPIGWGRLVPSAYEGPARDWDDSLRRSHAGIVQSLSLRWCDVLATEAAYEELATVLAEGLMHEDVSKLLGDLREHTLRLRDLVIAAGEACDLPSDPGQHADIVHSFFDWESIREVPPEKHAREWMHDKQREELEAWEREQAESISAES